MEIDVRKEKEDKPDVIRFSDGHYINCERESILLYDEDNDVVEIEMEHVPNLIKALKKYQELYGKE